MKVFVKTVTNFYLGEVVEQTDDEFVLIKAAWVADTRRFSQFMASGVPSQAEIELYPPDLLVHVRMDAVVDWSEWPHDLPKATQ
jgi:hypothetical protein